MKCALVLIAIIAQENDLRDISSTSMIKWARDLLRQLEIEELESQIVYHNETDVINANDTLDQEGCYEIIEDFEGIIADTRFWLKVSNKSIKLTRLFYLITTLKIRE